MTFTFRLITVALLKAARFTSNTSAAKYYIKVALEYEENAA